MRVWICVEHCYLTRWCLVCADGSIMVSSTWNYIRYDVLCVCILIAKCVLTSVLLSASVFSWCYLWFVCRQFSWVQLVSHVLCDTVVPWATSSSLFIYTIANMSDLVRALLNWLSVGRPRISSSTRLYSCAPRYLNDPRLTFSFRFGISRSFLVLDLVVHALSSLSPPTYLNCLLILSGARSLRLLYTCVMVWMCRLSATKFMFSLLCISLVGVRHSVCNTIFSAQFCNRCRMALSRADH